MKSQFQLCLMALLLLAGSILSACNDSSEVEYAPVSFSTIVFANMWDEVVALTDVQDRTAQLNLLSIQVDENGNLRSLFVEFHGLGNDGKTYWYHVEGINTLSWYSVKTDNFPSTLHPAYVFSNIDKAGITSVQKGEAGVNIFIDVESGGASYTSDRIDISLLSDGSVIPLRQIILNSNRSWVSVWIAQMHYIRQPSDNGSYSSSSSSSQIWILPQDSSQIKCMQDFDEQTDSCFDDTDLPKVEAVPSE